MILLSSAPSAMSLLAVSLAQVVFIPAINQTLSASFFWPQPVIPVRKAVLVSVAMSDVGISKHKRDGGGSPDEPPSPRAPLLGCAKLQPRASTPLFQGVFVVLSHTGWRTSSRCQPFTEHHEEAGLNQSCFICADSTCAD